MLLAKDEILGRQGSVGMRRESSQSDQVDDCIIKLYGFRKGV